MPEQQQAPMRKGSLAVWTREQAGQWIDEYVIVLAKEPPSSFEPAVKVMREDGSTLVLPRSAIFVCN